MGSPVEVFKLEFPNHMIVFNIEWINR
jgi:hypothetical protein